MARVIRRFRVSLGDTQREFAARTGLAIPTIGRYETNAQPSREVLARFSEIARTQKLSLFASIFDGQVEPDSVDFEAQEIAGALYLLQSALIELRQKRSAYRKARLLLSIHLLPPSEYANAERLLEDLVPTNAVDEAIEQAAGEVMKKNSVDPLRRIYFSCPRCGMINTYLEKVLERRAREGPVDSNGRPIPCCVGCHGELQPVSEEVAARLEKSEAEDAVRSALPRLL